MTFPASTPDHVEQVRALFLEYAATLGFDPCFQGLATELVELPGNCAPPRGAPVLAGTCDPVAAGSAGR